MAVEYICDMCGKRQTETLDYTISGEAFISDDAFPDAPLIYQFCSPDCARNFLTSEKLLDFGRTLAREITNMQLRKAVAKSAGEIEQGLILN